tara:strand:+ start:1026 stop:1274 length:249 start_codon:yes stop_codon:yes gene_type:complete
MKQVQKVWAELSAKEQKVELAMVPDILQDYKTMQKQLDAISNIAARRARDFDEVIKMAAKVGVDMDAKFKEAGKFFKKVEKL